MKERDQKILAAVRVGAARFGAGLLRIPWALERIFFGIVVMAFASYGMYRYDGESGMQPNGVRVFFIRVALAFMWRYTNLVRRADRAGALEEKLRALEVKSTKRWRNT